MKKQSKAKEVWVIATIEYTLTQSVEVFKKYDDAKKLFIRIVKEMCGNEKNMDEYLDNGYFERKDWTVTINSAIMQ
jgi:hypothetical protein